MLTNECVVMTYDSYVYLFYCLTNVYTVQYTVHYTMYITLTIKIMTYEHKT